MRLFRRKSERVPTTPCLVKLSTTSYVTETATGEGGNESVFVSNGYKMQQQEQNSSCAGNGAAIVSEEDRRLRDRDLSLESSSRAASSPERSTSRQQQQPAVRPNHLQLKPAGVQNGIVTGTGRGAKTSSTENSPKTPLRKGKIKAESRKQVK